MRRVLIALIALITACDDSTAPTSRTLQLISGQDQSGGSGATLAQPIVVRLVTDNGRPVANTAVHWRTVEGGGSVDSVETRTDSDGRASADWTLGNDTGRQTLLASAGNASLAIHATGTTRVAAVTAGFRHTCALTTSGVAFCWGDNSQGQLGNGTLASGATPVPIATSVRFRELAAAWSHTCGITIVGESLCWGDNSIGQAGIPATRAATPTPTHANDAFTGITTGFIHSCAITQGDVVCWGSNQQGQLGGAHPEKTRITGLQLTQVSAGEFHSCAIRASSTAVCWGWNTSGELGTGAASSAVVSTPTPVSGNLQFTRIAAGVRHTCALATGGRAYCWGRNAVGETGQDPFVGTSLPTEVPSGESFTSIGTGNTHTCALSGQRAFCWGSTPANGTAAATKFPTLVSSLQFTAIATGFDHSCAVADGAVWCWGSNSHGQLAQTSIAESIAPLRVTLPER